MRERSAGGLGICPMFPARHGFTLRESGAQPLLYKSPEFTLELVVPKRTLFTPSTDPTPPPPTALLLFIQRAQLELVYQERTEADVATDTPAPKHAA